MSEEPQLFGVIYADPPWRYNSGTVPPSDAIENHYPTMATEDICALEVSAAKDCILYLWATAPLIPEALQVITAWGFKYKSCAVWDKQVPGMGYWFRGQHELLLVGVRGNVSPPPQTLRISSVIRCRRGRHSAKPDYVRDQIAAWFPAVPRIEMFSRIRRPGWAAFGNEIENDLLSELPL